MKRRKFHAKNSTVIWMISIPRLRKHRSSTNNRYVIIVTQCEIPPMETNIFQRSILRECIQREKRRQKIRFDLFQFGIYFFSKNLPQPIFVDLFFPKKKIILHSTNEMETVSAWCKIERWFIVFISAEDKKRCWPPISHYKIWKWYETEWRWRCKLFQYSRICIQELWSFWWRSYIKRLFF